MKINGIYFEKIYSNKHKFEPSLIFNFLKNTFQHIPPSIHVVLTV